MNDNMLQNDEDRFLRWMSKAVTAPISHTFETSYFYDTLNKTLIKVASCNLTEKEFLSFERKMVEIPKIDYELRSVCVRDFLDQQKTQDLALFEEFFSRVDLKYLFEFRGEMKELGASLFMKWDFYYGAFVIKFIDRIVKEIGIDPTSERVSISSVSSIM